MHTPTAEDEHAIVVQAEIVPVIAPVERVREPPVELFRRPIATEAKPPSPEKLLRPKIDELIAEAVLQKPKTEAQQDEEVLQKPKAEARQAEAVLKKPKAEAQQDEAVLRKPKAEAQQDEAVLHTPKADP